METFSKKHQAVILILSLLVIVGFAASYYFYSQYQKTQTLITNPGLATQLQVKDITGKVGALMVLPTGEQPSIATVTDVTKLTGQSFFKLAKNGDKVLIYTKAKEAILYSESMNKILNVAPVNINTPQPIRIAIYNGSTGSDQSANLEQQIMSRANNVTISKKEKASATYTKTVVIDVNGNQANAASQLAQLIGGTVSQLPAGEAKPDADLLIILGSEGYQIAAGNTPAVSPSAAVVPPTASASSASAPAAPTSTKRYYILPTPSR